MSELRKDLGYMPRWMKVWCACWFVVLVCAAYASPLALVGFLASWMIAVSYVAAMEIRREAGGPTE